LHASRGDAYTADLQHCMRRALSKKECRSGEYVHKLKRVPPAAAFPHAQEGHPPSGAKRYICPEERRKR